MSNRKRLKKLILANKETRCLYRMMQLLAIFMIVSCLVIIATAKWIEYDQNKKREEIFGSWDEVFLNVDQDDLNYFRKNAFLEQISVQSIQEKVFLEGDQRVVVGACDDNFLEMGNIEILEGRMPEHEKEVAVEEKYLERLHVSGIGDIVPEDTKVRSLIGYKVTGIVENYSSSWKIANNDVNYINCFVELLTPNSSTINVYTKYNGINSYDIKINMLNYRENIRKPEISIINSLIRFIICVLTAISILCIAIILILKRIVYREVCVGFIDKNKMVTISLVFSLIIEMLFAHSIEKTVNDFVTDSIEIELSNTVFEDFIYYQHEITNNRNMVVVYSWTNDLDLIRARINCTCFPVYIVNEVSNILFMLDAMVIIILSIYLRFHYRLIMYKNYFTNYKYFRGRYRLWRIIRNDIIRAGVVILFFNQLLHFINTDKLDLNRYYSAVIGYNEIFILISIMVISGVLKYIYYKDRRIVCNLNDYC